jgi:hypothetical protein
MPESNARLATVDFDMTNTERGRDMVKRLAVTLGVVFVAATVGTASAQTSAMNKCQGAKIKDAGKKAACLAGLRAKVVGAGATLDPAKVAKCEAKVGAAYAKLEAKGPCNTGGDAGAIETKVDNFVDDLVSELDTGTPPPNKCQGAKIKDAGKKAACLAGLQAKFVASGASLDPAKVAKCEAKVGAAYTKLEAKGPCNTSGDGGAIETKVDNFVDDLVSELNVAGAPSCAPIVMNQPIANTYQLNGTTGEMRCTTNAASNRFGICTTDANCGNTAGSCMQLPWVTADGQIMSFPTGTSTKFTVATAGAYPTCEHDLCIPCGNPNAPCAGVPGCEVKSCAAGSRINLSCTTDDTNATTGCPGATCPGCCVNPNGCVPRGQQGCCNQPGFVVPTFFVNILGGLCSRVDQIGCGTGKINTSNPQTGDLNVSKVGDTTDPGPDCQYGTGDDPAPLACTLAGAGNDYAGKVNVSYGDGNPDGAGINFRLITPELSTTWTDSQSPPGSCSNGSTFDDGEILVSQLLLKAEPSTAGASGQFSDLSGDSCARAGQGFISSANPSTNGPIVVSQSPGPLKPQPYNGSTGSVSGAVSVVFSGPNSPIKDIGFVAITPQLAITTTSAASCSCTITPGCPE